MTNIEAILDTLIDEIGYQVTRDYKSKSGIWEGRSYSNEKSKRKALKALTSFEKAVREDEREKFNKYGRKYNKNPNRMLKSKHRYHVRVNKKFNNCTLCGKE